MKTLISFPSTSMIKLLFKINKLVFMMDTVQSGLKLDFSKPYKIVTEISTIPFAAEITTWKA